MMFCEIWHHLLNLKNVKKKTMEKWYFYFVHSYFVHIYFVPHTCFVFFNIKSSGIFVLFIYIILVRLWTNAESHLATMVMLFMAVSETFIDSIPFNLRIAYAYLTHLQLARKVWVAWLHSGRGVFWLFKLEYFSCQVLQIHS